MILRQECRCGTAIEIGMWDRKSVRAFETFQTDHVSCLVEPKKKYLYSVTRDQGFMKATCLVDDCTWWCSSDRKDELNRYVGEHLYLHGLAKAE